jgi:hypothetical protein
LWIDGRGGNSTAQRQTRRAEIEQTFAKYQVDLGNFTFSREAR